MAPKSSNYSAASGRHKEFFPPLENGQPHRNISNRHLLKLLEEYPYIWQLRREIRDNPKKFLQYFLHRLKSRNPSLLLCILRHKHILSVYLSSSDVA